MWSALGSTVGAFLGIAFFGLGVVQVFATIAGFEVWLGWGWVLAFIVAMLLGFLPIIGSIAGYFGATDGWGWEWWQALLLFGGVPATMLVIVLIGAGAGAAAERAQRRSLN